MEQRKCPECERPLFTGRPDKVYCSSRCRVRAHRKKQKREQAETLQTNEVTIHTDHPLQEQLRVQLRAVADRIQMLEAERNGESDKLDSIRKRIAAAKNRLDEVKKKQEEAERLSSHSVVLGITHLLVKPLADHETGELEREMNFLGQRACALLEGLKQIDGKLSEARAEKSGLEKQL